MDIQELETGGKKYFWRGLVTGLLIAIMLICGAYIGQRLFDSRQPASASAEEEKSVVTDSSVEKMYLLQQTIEQYYLEKADPDTLAEGAYKGIIEALGDPYSSYYSVEELKAIQEQSEGIYYGIGAYIGMDKEVDMARISKVMSGSPAEESGVLAGDYIYMIGEEYAKGMELEELISKVKGPEGTKVKLTIIRETEVEPIEIEVTRRKIESPTISHKSFEDGIAYIQIAEFDEVTLDQFTEALAEEKAAGMKGLIIDLRDNPGGNLNTVIDIARKILPEGIIVYTEDKYGERVEYTCDGKNELMVPIVVLVNGNSASASEILAGAIKDYNKGTLLGTTTYGKGIVQRIISLSDGSAVKLTVSSYFTPKGNNINKVGIEPDEELELDVEAYVNERTDNQLDRAIEILEQEIVK